MCAVLRDRQVTAITKMLTLGTAGELGEDFADQWKVLIYDTECGDIIAPLMNINALRQKGVTLHMLVCALPSKTSCKKLVGGNCISKRASPSRLQFALHTHPFILT